MGPDLMDKFRAQAEKFGLTLIADDIVSGQVDGPIKTLAVADGRTYQAKAVILAMGSGYRRLNVEGEEALSGHGVSWCATCDGFFFRESQSRLWEAAILRSKKPFFSPGLARASP